MKITFSLVTYNGMGGHPALSFVGDFLLLEAPTSFGEALATVDIYAHLQSSGPPLETLKSLRERFRERLKTLPLAWFRRKKCLLEIAYFSRVGTAEELLEQESKVISLIQFCDACREVVSLLSIIRKRLKKGDDFDKEALDSYLLRRLTELPTSVEELKVVLHDLRVREQQTIATRCEAK